MNYQTIKNLEVDMAVIKKEYKQNVKTKVIFLFELLAYAKDVRNTGLSWIIRSIWNIGEKVYNNHLPDYFDLKAKDFLLQKSELEALL